jgi:hypothetical protein
MKGLLYRPFRHAPRPSSPYISSPFGFVNGLTTNMKIAGTEALRPDHRSGRSRNPPKDDRLPAHIEIARRQKNSARSAVSFSYDKI